MKKQKCPPVTLSVIQRRRVTFGAYWGEKARCDIASQSTAGNKAGGVVEFEVDASVDASETSNGIQLGSAVVPARRRFPDPSPPSVCLGEVH
ncbi:MAG: hypothetical protein HYV60_24570 [Planctomycetia bacterium]|nr:hypothetical protein [Planctomycetia bacterium]